MTGKKRVIIIGGGLGGLSAAIRLQYEGFHTTILEKNDFVGGKLHEIKLGSYRFDFGPNIITMPHVFRSVVSQTNENPDDYFQFMKLETHTKNSFYDGTHLYLSSNKEEMKEHLLTLDPSAADSYDDYLFEVEKLHKIAQKHIIHKSFNSWKDYLSLPLVKAMFSAKPFQSLDRFHQQFFRDERVRMTFNRYATYIGSSPYTVPAMFGLIGYLEMEDGVYFTKGGNTEIIRGFVRLAKKLGVKIITNCEVSKSIIKNKVIQSVITVDEVTYEGDVFILNGDLFSQNVRLFGQTKRGVKKMKLVEPSSSAFVILACLNSRLNFHHHHLFFNNHPKKEFHHIFHEQSYIEEPSIYTCTSSKTMSQLSPDGDNLYILVNAPPLSQSNRPNVSVEEQTERIFNVLKKRGMDIKPHLAQLQTIDPYSIEKKFYAYLGTLNGVSSNIKRNLFFRPYNRSQEFDNLYFVGGSTYPGGGSPIVVLSGSNVANEINNSFK
ncbi:phytoene desaturase family protein [Evansella halocellulosilytica]|uniref:phytoene desaturase family protein n=1 Tax=Evansella halocellulosilytica TaxID=2011013 RepID=UPI000BB83172|nr:phytoene desaturase family protein [Evansella halocellulosilytica]